jgi:putative inorganic carbon (HCO3(-)) transporter
VNISKILEKYWNYILSIVIFILLIPLINDSGERVIVIASFLIFWNLAGVLLKDYVKASVLTLLLMLPFNITYQLPYSILGIQLAEPFVDGVIVNYLIPTISILDLGVILLLLSLFVGKKIELRWKGFSFLKIFVMFGIYLTILSIFKGGFLSILNSFRILLYIFTFYSLFKNIKEILNQRIYTYILLGTIALVVFQGVLAFSQFRDGTSLGLTFLGESQVVSGMMGSSFLNLDGSLYLRGYGTFPHPNVFAGWLILNILLGWYLFDNMNRRRDISIALMVMSSLSLVLTFSRIAFLVCTIIWIAFLIKVFFNSRRLKTYSFLGLMSERLSNLFTGGDTSWGDRVGLMESSFSVIRENMLTGVGLGRFIPNMGDTVPRSGSGILLLQPVHNIFLLFISEIGLIGFTLFSTLLYFFFKKREWSLRFIIGLIAILIIGMFDHYLLSLPQGLAVFLLILVI